MRQAVVKAAFRQFLFRHALAAFNTEGIGAADCEMVGGILIEQRVVIQNIGFRNRGLMGNQSDLAQIFGAFVK
ncbi:hypothetical protein D3C73_1582280 [compost metagenome]